MTVIYLIFNSFIYILTFSKHVQQGFRERLERMMEAYVDFSANSNSFHLHLHVHGV
jgi:hypothetical protein